MGIVVTMEGMLDPATSHHDGGRKSAVMPGGLLTVTPVQLPAGGYEGILAKGIQDQMLVNSGGPAAKNSSQTVQKTRSTTNAMEPHTQGLTIQSEKDTRNWLYNNGHLDSMEDTIEIDMLKGVLLQLAQRHDLPTEVKNGMRVVAHGMESMKAGEMERIVAETMERAMEEYRGVLESMAEASVRTVKGMAEQVRETTERLEEGQIQEDMRRQSKMGYGEEGVRGTQRMGLTFAEAAQRAEREDIVQQANNKTRQLLIDNTEGTGRWKELTEKELIEKAKITKDMMGIQELDSPKVEFLSVRKLRNGGVLYKLSSTDATKWLACKDIWKAFLEKFRAGTKVKKQGIQRLCRIHPNHDGGRTDQWTGKD
ncbi:hypothetical protein E4T56_gene11132 [Termitomyces sp. T112]|nr:hypothetical protein E4T56_gene11132 [Termitomyces sp. T112]